MNSESKVNAHFSSLVGLKAELLRKQAEIDTKKSEYDRANWIEETKSKLKKHDKERRWTDLNKCKRKEESQDIQSKKALEKSKLMLQAKSQLYNELSKKHVNMNPKFLVDFNCKPDEMVVPDVIDQDYYNSGHEWVEYTDCLGRTRKCLHKDLPKVLKEDDDLDKSIRKEIYQEKSKGESSKSLSQVEEPEIEMMRRKWEEQTAKLVHKTDVHYQDVLFDEARSHGVGYYAFSQHEGERAKQQESLFKLRKETEQKQKEIQELQEMKNRMTRNRLRAARLRHKIRAGLSAEVKREDIVEPRDGGEHITDDEKSRSLTNDVTQTTSTSEDLNLKVDQSELDSENQIQAFGKLLGKRNQWYVMSQKEWIQKKREERQEEFAPAYNNFVSPGASFINEVLPSSQGKENPDTAGSEAPLFTKELSNLTVRSDLTGTSGPTNDSNTKQIADQIGAGLKFLRKQLEERDE